MFKRLTGWECPNPNQIKRASRVNPFGTNPNPYISCRIHIMLEIFAPTMNILEIQDQSTSNF